MNIETIINPEIESKTVLIILLTLILTNLLRPKIIRNHIAQRIKKLTISGKIKICEHREVC